jgi:hypothetical protein
MRRIVQWLLILALSLSIGLQWVVVQSAAWVGMFVANSRETSTMRSLVMTFDGQHECKVCKALDRGEESTKKQMPSRDLKIHPMAAPLVEEFVFEIPALKCGTSVEPWTGLQPVAPPLRPPERA